jgi:4-hydroxybenzoate polyprenyltransferase
VTWSTLLRLGRVSNLPTVWTNVLAAAALAGPADAPGPPGSPGSLVTWLVLALSLFYVGGMYLNDAFDREIDARERPERPIPSGLAGAATVFAIGYGLLAAGLGLLAALALVGVAPGGWSTVGAGAVLAAAIVYYDARHQTNPWSPLVMGACRGLVYVTTGLAVAGRLTAPVLGGALVLLAYLIGLTYVARQETLTAYRNVWPLALLAAPFVYAGPALARPLGAALYVGLLAWVGYAVSLLLRRKRVDIPRAVVSLIAGICLLDALLIVGTGQDGRALAAVAAFALTLALQRRVPGT